MSYSYSPDTSFVKTYWVKNDTNSWIDNAKNTSYTFNLTQGIHKLYVKAQQQDDFNAEATAIIVEIIQNVPSGQTGTPGDGSAGITNSTSYWLCNDSNCTTKCQAIIKNGIITGCT